MKCTEAQQLIQPYLNHELDSRKLREFLDHVENCQECYEELEIYLAVQQTLKDTDQESEVDYDLKRSLKRYLESSRTELRMYRLQKILMRILVLMILLMGAGMVYFGFMNRDGLSSPPWAEQKETQISDDSLPEAVSESSAEEESESVAQSVTE